MDTGQVIVLILDGLVAIPVLTCLTLRLRQYYHHRHHLSHPDVKHRPLPLLVFLHFLLLCHFLPTLLSLLLPSFPCPLLLIPLYISSHLVLSLVTLSSIILYLHSTISTSLLTHLSPPSIPSPTPTSHSPSPSLSLTLPSKSYTENHHDFIITITSVSPTPSPLSSSRLPTVPFHFPSPPPYHRYQRYKRWAAPAFILISLLLITSIFITLLDANNLSSTCTAHPPLLITHLCTLILYIPMWAYLTHQLRSAPNDRYGRRREVTLLLSVSPLYITSLVLLLSAPPVYGTFWLHVSLALVSLITTVTPLYFSRTPPVTLSFPSNAQLHDLLLTPPAALLTFFHSSFVLPELSFLLTLSSYHRLFTPSPSFHLPLRNPHLERIKHKKRRKSSASVSPLPSPSPPSTHLVKLLQSANEVYEGYLGSDSWQRVEVEERMREAVREGLERLMRESEEGVEEGEVGGPGVKGTTIRLEKKKDAVQCMLELGELYTPLERYIVDQLITHHVRPWLIDHPLASSDQSSPSSSRSTGEPSPRPAGGKTPERPSTPSPPMVVKGSLASLQAMHQEGRRAGQERRVRVVSEGVRHGKSRSLSEVRSGEGRGVEMGGRERRASLEGSGRRNAAPHNRPIRLSVPHDQPLLMSEITRAL